MGRSTAVWLALAASAALAGAVMAGCGGGGSSSPSKSEFIAQADAICKKTDEAQTPALRQAVKESAGSSKAKQEEAFIAAGLRPVREEAQEIGKLAAPSGNEAEVEAFVKGIEEAVASVEKNPKTANHAFVAVEREAAKFGFKDCAEPL